MDINPKRRFFAVYGAALIISLFSTSLLYAAERSASPVGLAFIATSVELRKTQKIEVEKVLAQEKKRAEEASKRLTLLLGQLSNEIQAAHEQIENANEQEVDVLNKKTAVLNDRKQNLIDQQELWREIQEVYEQRIKGLSDLIDYMTTPKVDLKPAYSWKEFRDSQLRLAEQKEKVEVCQIKRDNLKKQRIALNERLASLERQRSVKTKERERLIAQIDRQVDREKGRTTLRYEGDTIAQELLAIAESMESVKLNVEKVDAETRFWEDMSDLEQQRYYQYKNLLNQMEQRLVLDHSDVEVARSDWKNEAHNALMIKEKINALREPKKEAKEKVAAELELLRQSLTSVAPSDKEGKEPIEAVLLKTRIRRLTALLHAAEKELAVLDAKKELADMIATERELQYNMVEMRYRLRLETENLDELYAAFANKRDLAASSLREIKDKRTQAINQLIEVNRSIERIKSYQKRLQARRHVASMRLREVHVRELLQLMEETANYLAWQLNFTQSYLAVNADLLAHQEKILSQYDAILHEIDHRLRNFSIWKRSPKAISYEALVAAVLEGEAFFKKLYWETPAHIRPSALVDLVRSWNWQDFLLLLCFIVFFLVSFRVTRLALQVLRNKLSVVTERYKGHTRYLYFHAVQTFLDFVLEYFTIFFTWFFLFLHVICNFAYVFSTLRPLVSSYSVAVFHLFSIPLLIFLTSCFISLLRDVNERLSYVLFAEKFQNRFVLLISIFCYATAVVIPLRLALVSYTDGAHSEFSTLILAAYSLITALVVAFLFNKEDILRHIPSTTSFLIMIKRKIDKHYYSVFFFMMSLFVLSNPYVGYSNMAWFLAFAVPGSIMLVYVLFSAHHLIRRYAVFLFMKEDEDEFIDKFEHAKAYYGFFVIFSFLVLLFVTFLLVSRIWGFVYSPADIWKALSEQWVVQISLDHKIGFVQFMILGMFITAGFFISSITHRFILTRLFDILRSEPGIQNTISRICHYTIIFIAIILGLIAIHLQQFMLYVGASFGIALGFALKDIGADILSGIFVLIERPLEIGNYVQIDTIQGTVHKIAARSTTIITSKNHSVIIPNRDLVSKWIINWGHGRYSIGFEVNVRVDPSCDPELTRRILYGVVQAHPLILKVPGVVTRLEEFEENAFVFLLRGFISARRVKEQWEIAAAIRTEVVKAFKEHGLRFARAERALVITSSDSGQVAQSVEIKFDK